MEDFETVKVHAFRIFDADIGAMRHATYKATRMTIATRLSGEVLEGTEEEVPSDELDEHGRFRRIATGWGVLS